ncbi:MAG: indolepyruvate ferredoxin oxidoreductase family protein [Nitratireductor sp.]|nr:indolepyruvate ferredoxin oxidoreductase family protein [Nitratireductor sp.]
MGVNDPKFDPYSAVTLEDKYTAEEGKVFINGTQALVRLPMVQMRRDRAAGLNTGTFISGYRGSPVGGFDLTLGQAREHLKKHDIHFLPGINEDLAATAVWGSQQLSASPGAKKDGVLGIWYGKGPGVDRCGDVFKHANSFGTSPHGGVLAIAGDDHLAKSSTVAHQSDHAFMAAIMPVLFPSSVQEFTELGLLGIAMSRYSGLWVGYKVIADTIETTGVVDLAGEQRLFVTPNDFEMPQGGLNIRWPDDRFAQDERIQEYKAYAAIAFARANKIDQLVIDSRKPRIGIVASGKAYENVREALRHLDIDEKTADRIGLRLYKVRMPWPLEPEGIRQFSEGLEEVLVVEERREVIEHQIKQQLFNWRDDVRPRIVGKFDHKDRHVLSLHEEMTAGVATRIIATRLLDFDLPESLRENLKRKLEYYNERHQLRLTHKTPVNRVAHFCAGCPHNTSTKVPEGSRAFAGIGCHFMALWMDRNTETYTHMGGEGVPWSGIAPFTNEKHVFANLGDGTYFHSGIMAIRQSVASGANITYKLLYNDAVAMTGGQKIDGSLTVPELAAQLQAEGIRKLWLVSDEPEKYSGLSLPAGITIRHRDWLDDVQQQARETEGCTAIIYDQTCATEKRRRRKRGTMVDPDKRVFINPLVCEGCGDCSVQSNCIAVEPLETEFGRKRQINQSSCNKDFSCVKGFCPSFVTVQGASLKKRELPELSEEALPVPEVVPLADNVYNIAITGVGGTGVLTIGAIIGMAAHIDGKAAMIQDFSGLAQKGGAVLSHIRLSKTTDLVAAAQIPPGEADLLMAADTVVASDKGPVTLYSTNRTRAILNTHLTPVSSFVFDRDFDFRETAVINAISKGIKDNPDKVDFTRLAELVCGDSIATNIMMLGYASQKGTLPVGVDALEKAIELNGVAIKANKLAFNWGRRFAEKPEEALRLLAEAHGRPAEPETLEQLVDRRAAFLAAYQNAAYAKRYRDFVAGVETAEAKLGDKRDLTEAVARNLFKLMAYKDEYEVARLYTDGSFEKELKDAFDGDLKLTFHLAPPILGGKPLANGRPRKRQFGPWMMTGFRFLAGMKGLRGTAFDPFGRTAERKMERRLIGDYEAMISGLLPKLSARNFRFALALARVPDAIRGYGPVKEKSVADALKTQASLLGQFENPPAETAERQLEAAE